MLNAKSERRWLNCAGCILSTCFSHRRPLLRTIHVSRVLRAREPVSEFIELETQKRKTALCFDGRFFFSNMLNTQGCLWPSLRRRATDVTNNLGELHTATATFVVGPAYSSTNAVSYLLSSSCDIPGMCEAWCAHLSFFCFFFPAYEHQCSAAAGGLPRLGVESQIQPPILKRSHGRPRSMAPTDVYSRSRENACYGRVGLYFYEAPAT